MLYGPRGILNLARARERKEGARGQIMVLFTLVIVLLMVLAAVVIDIGLLRTDGARLQNALDAGALAGANGLPATSTNVNLATGPKTTANQYVTANYTGVAAPTITFRCLIGLDLDTSLPRTTDMPTVCNVSYAANDSHWECTATVCWAPCDPAAIATDVCNTINLTDSETRDYGFGGAVGINSGSTGTRQSAACSGLCGYPPTVPLDTVLIIDRTISMGGNRNSSGHPSDSAATTGVRAGADEVLSVFDPKIQRVAFGALGVSSIIRPSAAYLSCTGSPQVSVSAMHIGDTPGVAYGSTSTATNTSYSTALVGTPSTLSTMSNTSLNLAVPGAAAPGNLLVATVTVAGGGAVTAPAGWTVAATSTNAGNVSVRTWYRLAPSPVGGPYNFSWTGSHAAVGAMAAYSGVDTTTPLDVAGAAATNNGTNVRATRITTTGTNSRVIGFFATSSSATLTTPAGMALVFPVTKPSSGGPTLEVADFQNATPGDTGNMTATASAGGQWAAHLVSFNAAVRTSSSLTISRPGSTATGVVRIASVSVSGGSGTAITSPAGWTLIRRTDNGSGVAVASYYKVDLGSEPASYTWTIGSGQAASGSISSYTNVDTANVLDPAAIAGSGGTENTGSGTSVSANAITTGTAYAQLIGVYATTPRTSFTKPSAMVERSDTAFPSGGPTLEVADDQLVAASSSGTQTATALASGAWAAQLFALRALPVDTYSIDVNDPLALKSWIPIGFTGIDGDSPDYGTAGMRGNNEAYSTNGVVNGSSHIAQAAQCFDGTYQGGPQFDGTNLATPIRMATKYLHDYGRSGVQQAIIIETDGYPQSCPSSVLSAAICSQYTGPAAQSAADAAKAAGIMVYTIGYNGGSLTSSAATLLGNMASTQALASSCNAAENTDGDTFFCAPTAADLKKVFQYVAEALASGPRLVQLYAQPVVTSVSASCGAPAGGASVSISGDHFTDAYSVTFGGTASTSFSVASDGMSIVAKAPPGTHLSTVDITVSTPGGSSKLVANDRCTYS
jgi:Flp pilus assembly protein TadG